MATRPTSPTAHLGFPEELRDNVEIACREASHMIYIREVDHAKLKKDAAGFILGEGAMKP